ncbi:hypothetical protein [Salmonella enterica]|nr:hypothetical protein [Salmonella enterica]ETC69547.1 hypothetical protein SEEE3402_11270 [Salmonella enterica subsp. enterica serovar Enteritidis str. 3402]OHJ18653.1 hypothetical protein A7S44_21330 [Salmonella enterica]
MANNGNGGPGKTRHLNDIAARYGNKGMHVICVRPTENDLCSSDSVLCAPALDGKAGFFQCVLQHGGHSLLPGKPGKGMSATKQQMTRVFLAMSDVGQIKALYSGEDGKRLAEDIRQNCNIVYPLRPLDEWHTACAELPESLIFPSHPLKSWDGHHDK